VPLYRSMIESFSDGQGGYSPGVVWLYDPRSSEIRIAWRMGFDDRGQFARSRVASALADGWHGADIWAYYAGPRHRRSGVDVTRSDRPGLRRHAREARLFVTAMQRPT
jgi:hypothetical protein